jgi:hypothetical protein
MAEYNILQNPDLIRRLQRRTGIRQAHIAPALNEGVQTVIILDDLTQQRSDTILYATGVRSSGAGDGVSNPIVGLLNPVGSHTIARVLFARGNTVSAGSPIALLLLGTPINPLPAGVLVNGTAGRYQDVAQVTVNTVLKMLSGKATQTALDNVNVRLAGAFDPIPGATQPIAEINCRDQQFSLPPGAAFIVQHSGVAVTDNLNNWTFFWYEEPLT